MANLIAYLIGVAAAWIGNFYNIGIPPLQGIIIAALMVPVINVIFDMLGIDDKHQVM